MSENSSEGGGKGGNSLSPLLLPPPIIKYALLPGKDPTKTLKSWLVPATLWCLVSFVVLPPANAVGSGTLNLTAGRAEGDGVLEITALGTEPVRGYAHLSVVGDMEAPLPTERNDRKKSTTNTLKSYLFHLAHTTLTAYE